jgi:uncharacterized membrane protein YoaK (UPF0700 family)
LVGFFGVQSDLSTLSGKWIAFSMLFSMGVQNSMVTQISNSIVRTTHDRTLYRFRIELSQFFFYKAKRTKKLSASIYLRLSIIIFFFYWLYLWGFLYTFLEIKTLFVAACFLLIALIYDYIRLQFLVIKEEISLLD